MAMQQSAMQEENKEFLAWLSSLLVSPSLPGVLCGCSKHAVQAVHHAPGAQQSYSRR